MHSPTVVTTTLPRHSQLNSFFDLSSFRPSETETVPASDGFEECESETDRTSESEAEA